MNKEKDFFKTCFDTVAGLEVKNESQAIAKEVVLSEIENLQEKNQQLKDKLSKIETLIINHNCDTGDIYYKYNSRFLKSELKERILDILNEVSE